MFNQVTQISYAALMVFAIGCGDMETTEAPLAATIEDAYLFYNGSAWDSATDATAIAIDKQPLLAGQTATADHYTGYAHGINGVMIDINNLLGATLAAGDLEFRVGTDNAPETWEAAPTPLWIGVELDAGVNGSDRVTVIWERGEITNTWLQIRVVASETTGLSDDYVFYFGSLVGDIDPIITDGNFAVSLDDTGKILDALRSPSAQIDTAADLNKDKIVDIQDSETVLNHLGTSLPVLTVPEE